MTNSPRSTSVSAVPSLPEAQGDEDLVPEIVPAEEVPAAKPFVGLPPVAHLGRLLRHCSADALQAVAVHFLYLTHLVADPSATGSCADLPLLF